MTLLFIPRIYRQLPPDTQESIKQSADAFKQIQKMV